MFYKDCYYCNKDSTEKCFECSQAIVTKENWIYSLGYYYPRFQKEHENSAWSKAILIAKRNFSMLSVFASITAFYLDKLEYLKPFTLTHVPEFQDKYYLFNLSRMEILANICFSKLQDKKWINKEKILIQTNKKKKKQRYCSTDKERFQNVQGIYSVANPERIKGKNIILLDDVTTTGATLRECSNLLLNAGAINVTGLVLAKTFR